MYPTVKSVPTTQLGPGEDGDGSTLPVTLIDWAAARRVPLKHQIEAAIANEKVREW